MRKADVKVRAFLAQDVADAQLMLRLAIGVNERNRDRLDLLLAQRVGERAHRAFVERQQHAAVGGDALRRFEPQRTRNQWCRPHHFKIVLVEAVAERELDRVLEARRGDQRGAGATALDDGIGAERGAVDDQADAVGRDAGLAENQRDGAHDSFLGRVSGGEHLAREKAARGLQHDIRKGPSDIDRQPATIHHLQLGIPMPCLTLPISRSGDPCTLSLRRGWAPSGSPRGAGATRASVRSGLTRGP